MRGDYDDLDSAPETLCFAGELNAFDPSQSEVRSDEVEPIRPQARDCAETVRYSLDIAFARRENARERLAYRGFGVHNKDTAFTRRGRGPQRPSLIRRSRP